MKLEYLRSNIKTKFAITFAPTVAAIGLTLAGLSIQGELRATSPEEPVQRLSTQLQLPQNSPIRGKSGDLWADIVIGQPDFTQITPNEVVNNKLFNPGGVYIDRSVVPNRAYVYDAGNSRILGFSSLGIAQGGPEDGQPCTSDSDHPNSKCVINETRRADIVIGQPSFNTSACNGDSGFQNYPNFPKPSASTLCGLRSDQISILEGGSGATLTTDVEGNLYHPDIFNNRVLRYDNPFKKDTTADYIWGQPDFESRNCNRDTNIPSNDSLCLESAHGNSSGAAIDSQGNLWITDTGNDRVLRFPFDAALGVPSPNADRVLGLPDFSTQGGSGMGGRDNLDQMNRPASIRVGRDGSVYVADGLDGWGHTLSRILIFRPPLSNGINASQAINEAIGRKINSLELDRSDSLWALSVPAGNNAPDQKIRLFNILNGSLQRIISEIDGKEGIAIDRDDNIFTTGWNPQAVLRFSPPFYQQTDTTLRPNQYGTFNHRGSRGMNDPGGLEVTACQLITSDGSRMLFWENPLSLTNGQPANGVVGQPDFLTPARSDPGFGRIELDNKGHLWVLRGDGSKGWLESYKLPLRSGSDPTKIIPWLIPLKGGGVFSYSKSVVIGGIAYQEKTDGLWISDTGENDYNPISRVFRIKNVNTNPEIDIVLGQKNISETRCNQGRDPDYGYLPYPPLYPTQDSLCHPGALTFDKKGNLYVADNSLEVAGNRRLLEYDANTIPDNPATAVFGIPATRVFGRNGSFTEAKCYSGLDPLCEPWEPAFNSKNEMVVGFNGYDGSRFPFIYRKPLTELLPSGILNDFTSHPYSARFDLKDNLYMLDMTRSRVLIYKEPLKTAHDVYLPFVRGPLCYWDEGEWHCQRNQIIQNEISSQVVFQQPTADINCIPDRETPPPTSHPTATYQTPPESSTPPWPTPSRTSRPLWTPTSEWTSTTIPSVTPFITCPPTPCTPVSTPESSPTLSPTPPATPVPIDLPVSGSFVPLKDWPWICSGDFELKREDGQILILHDNDEKTGLIATLTKDSHVTLIAPWGGHCEILDDTRRAQQIKDLVNTLIASGCVGGCNRINVKETDQVGNINSDYWLP